MDDFFLYITVPERKNREIPEEKLPDILRMAGDSVLRLTWRMDGRQAGYSGIRRVIRCLKRLEKEPGNRVLVNTLEFGTLPNGFLPLRTLSQYRFRIAFRFPTAPEDGKISRMVLKLARHGIIHVFHACPPSESEWRSWLGSTEYRLVEPYLDYLKIIQGNEPLSCRYHSCLGRTLALDAEGRWSICPYRESPVRIHDPAGCDTIDGIFQTDDFMALLGKQIEVRENCAARCPYYRGCKGGCPLSREKPCPEPELFRALQAAEEKELPPDQPAVREERLYRLAQRFTV